MTKCNITKEGLGRMIQQWNRGWADGVAGKDPQSHEVYYMKGWQIGHDEYIERAMRRKLTRMIWE